MIIAALASRDIKIEDEPAVQRAIAKMTPRQAAMVAFGIDRGRSLHQDLEKRRKDMKLGEPIEE